jgi:hypothetical protein
MHDRPSSFLSLGPSSEFESRATLPIGRGLQLLRLDYT